MDRPTCSTCPYWEAIDDTSTHFEERRGECHRYPKKLSDALLNMLALYMEGAPGVSRESPLENSDVACEVWETMSQYDIDQSVWVRPIETSDGWCGEHPDFPQWIESRKAKPDA